MKNSSRLPINVWLKTLCILTSSFLFCTLVRGLSARYLMVSSLNKVRKRAFSSSFWVAASSCLLLKTSWMFVATHELYSSRLERSNSNGSVSVASRPCISLVYLWNTFLKVKVSLSIFRYSVKIYWFPTTYTPYTCLPLVNLSTWSNKSAYRTTDPSSNSEFSLKKCLRFVTNNKNEFIFFTFAELTDLQYNE